METSQPASIRCCALGVRNPSLHRLNDLRSWLPKSSGLNLVHNSAPNGAVNSLLQSWLRYVDHLANNTAHHLFVYHRPGARPHLASCLTQSRVPNLAKLHIDSASIGQGQSIILYVDHRLDLHVDRCIAPPTFSTALTNAASRLWRHLSVTCSNNIVQACATPIDHTPLRIYGHICYTIVIYLLLGVIPQVVEEAWSVIRQSIDSRTGSHALACACTTTAMSICCAAYMSAVNSTCDGSYAVVHSSTWNTMV